MDDHAPPPDQPVRPSGRVIRPKAAGAPSGTPPPFEPIPPRPAPLRPSPAPAAQGSAFAAVWYSHGPQLKVAAVILGIVAVVMVAKAVPGLMKSPYVWEQDIHVARNAATVRKVPLVTYSVDPRFGGRNAVFLNQTIKDSRLKALAADTVWFRESGSGAPYHRNPQERSGFINSQGNLVRDGTVTVTYRMSADGWTPTDSTPIEPPLVMVMAGDGTIYHVFEAADVVTPAQLARAIEDVRKRLKGP